MESASNPLIGDLLSTDVERRVAAVGVVSVVAVDPLVVTGAAGVDGVAVEAGETGVVEAPDVG